MRPKRVRLAVPVILAVMLCFVSCRKEAENRESAAADSLCASLLITHLQAHFDDLHDVTMRFHHRDHALNGIIELKVRWEDGELTGTEVVANETGSDDLAEALLEKMQAWRIGGLDGPFETVVPINVKIVGLDDPEFPNTAILTGEIKGAEGNPLEDVMVLIKPEVAGMVLRARTNREGIFVRTLIPPGTWDVEYSLQGYEAARKEGIKLSAGKHVRESVVLEKK